MNILEKLQDKNIIICEKSYKENILKYMSENHLFLHVKFYTKKEFFQEYLFSYDEKTIYYLVEKNKIKIDIAKMYLNNLYFINSNSNYKSSKLNYLVSLKQELDEKKLLYYNENFKEYIKNYKIIVVGYSYIENYERKILDDLFATYVTDDDNYSKKLVFEFNDKREEINYVCKSIAKLIKKGTNIKKIKLMNVSEDYYNDLKLIFKFYNIPIKVPSSNNLFSNEITKLFLDKINNGLDYAFNCIKNMNNDIVNKIINIVNKYNFIKEMNILKEFLIYEFKNYHLDNFNLENYIEIININDYVNDNDYIFLINFNTGFIPVSYKDDEYITDNIKDELEMDKVVVKNRKEKEYTVNKIRSIKNLIITYKLKDSKKEYFPSILVSDMNLEVKRVDNDILNSYSKEYDKIILAKLEDKYHKYGTTSDNYFIYKNNLNIPYKTYDNKFKGINKEMLKEYLNNKLTLSYSSLNNYNKCAFRYYISNILKLDPYEDNFEAFIGSIFHDVLEKCFSNNLNVEEEIKKYIEKSGRIITIKERFYVRKITEDIKFVIDVLNKQKENINLDNALFEKNIVINKDNGIKIEFIGFIDKILYKEEDDKTLVTIIDYKTGNVSTNLNYLLYGLNLQLPIYIYLVKKSNLFKNPKFVGFYLQYILDKDIKKDNNSSYIDKRKDKLKLVGYSNSDISILSRLDDTYENSNLIKGMRVKKDGEFYSNASVLNNYQIEKIIELTEENIDKNIEKILNGDFSINPKKIGFDKDVGCEYCHFKDICNKCENDYVILDEINFLNFLGGDNNA